MASLRAQAPGMSTPASGTIVANGISPAEAEDEEEGDLLEPVTNQFATTGFLPPQAELQSAEGSEDTTAATASQPIPTAPRLHPEALFHFTPPRRRPVLLATTVGAAHRTSRPSAASLAAAAFTGSPPVQLALFHKESMPGGNRTGKIPTGLLSTNENLEESKPKSKIWPPRDDTYTVCDPPCIQGRGICNDNVCFCRSPFTGSTCQHKQTGLYRAPRVMVLGCAACCILFGLVSARLVFALSQRKIEKRLEHYGKGKQKFETWSPPAAKKPAEQ